MKQSFGYEKEFVFGLKCSFRMRMTLQKACYKLLETYFKISSILISIKYHKHLKFVRIIQIQWFVRSQCKAEQLRNKNRIFITTYFF